MNDLATSTMNGCVQDQLAEGGDKPELDLPVPVPLSWDLEHIHDRVAPVGWKPVTWKMIKEVLLCTFCAVVYGFSFTALEPFYQWPPVGDGFENGTEAEDFNSTRLSIPLEYVLTDEESFECNGTWFYKNGTGPLFDLEDDQYVLTDGLFGSLMRTMGTYWGIAIFLFVAFTVVQLYFGRYNELLGIVKFKEAEGEDGHVRLQPIAFSFVFTIM